MQEFLHWVCAGMVLMLHKMYDFTLIPVEGFCHSDKVWRICPFDVSKNGDIIEFVIGLQVMAQDHL